MSKKVIIGVAGVCALLLTFICGAMFYVSWTTITTMAQLREENYRLSLEAASYKMRLEEAGVNVSALASIKPSTTKPSANSEVKKATDPVQAPTTDAKDKIASVESKKVPESGTKLGANPTTADTKKHEVAAPIETKGELKTSPVGDSRAQSAEEGKKVESTTKQSVRAKSKEKSKSSKVSSKKKSSKSSEKKGTPSITDFL